MRKRDIRIVIVLLACVGLAAFAASVSTIDSMETMSFAEPKEKGSLALVDGKVGKAIRFSFEDDSRNAFALRQGKATPDWDKAAGFSFWVKGDGSDHLGGIQFIWNGDYATRYGYAFPIDSKEWKKIVVPWRDLLPELSRPQSPIHPRRGNAPSKLGPISFGKWWYWRDYARHSYVIDEIRLAPSIPLDTNEYRPKGAPLGRVLAKLRTGKPVTIVTMGDSLTDFSHWANREVNWPTLLKTKLKEKYGSDITVVNPAIGGTELRQNLVLLPRWARRNPEPDLVTVFFGGNDWNGGMRGAAFFQTQKEAVDRIRRATKGKADVLILTTCPSLENGTTYQELAVACRQAARTKNAGLADVYTAFQKVSAAEDRERLYVRDKVHLAPGGHALVVQTVAEALTKGGR